MQTCAASRHADMLAHVIARAIGIAHCDGFENALVLIDRIPQIAAPLGRQALTFRQNVRKCLVHVDQKFVSSNTHDDLMESEIGLGVGNEVVRLRRAAKRFYAFLQLFDFPFRMAGCGELGCIALDDVTELVDLRQGIARREAPRRRSGNVPRVGDEAAPSGFATI